MPRTPPFRIRRAAFTMRLFGLVTVPVTLAGLIVAPSAVVSHAPAAATAAQVSKLVPLPDLHAPSTTVTLITGDQVRLTEAGGGRYTATGVPGSGPSTMVAFTGQGDRTGLDILQAIPDAAAPLIATGQLDQNLFDVRYLATHGDTGSAAQIPITLQYVGKSGAAELRTAAAGLPGATVQGTTPARGEVTVKVAAKQAGAFWTALTGPATKTGGVTQVWLTGHKTAATDPSPQAGEPLYTVTETIKSRPGPLSNGCLGRDQQGALVTAAFCLTIPTPSLLGVAGAGAGLLYEAATPFGPFGVCISQTPAQPFPVCTAWQVTYRVPAGIYAAHANGVFSTTDDADGTLEQATVALDVPQLTVTGDTSINIDANKAVPVTVDTPQPAVPYGPESLQATRTLPDGNYFTNGLENLDSQGIGNWWAIPTPAGQRATVGGFHLSPELSMGARPVSASVTAPTNLTLHPIYPCDANQFSACNNERFTGKQTFDVVDAGQGSAADFAKIDARGKLALVRTCQDPNLFTGGCIVDSAAVMEPQLANAQQAGAAGVLLDAATNRRGYPNRLPALVATPGGVGLDALNIHVPFAEIDGTEGTAVRDLLANGPVKITINSIADTPHIYELWFDQEAAIPASLHYRLTSRQLAEVDASYNDPTATHDFVQEWHSAFRPDDFFAVGIALDHGLGRSFREYFGPLSPDLVWHQQMTQAPGEAFSVFDRPTKQTIGWNAPPRAPGALPTPTDVEQARPDSFYDYCAGCRQGDTFWPVFQDISGAGPRVALGAFGFDADEVHLYDANDQEIPATTEAGIAAYKLPAERARYKLVTPDTTWHFTSAEPATDHSPDGTGCAGTAFGLSTAPCQADPLVFLRYNAGLRPDNTATPGVNHIRVTAYYQDPKEPQIAEVKLWTSVDGGDHWTPTHLVRRGTNPDGGTDFDATVNYPKSGTVSLKATARDAAGNDVSQTLLNAFSISAQGANR